jgi:hypothetical protein
MGFGRRIVALNRTSQKPQTFFAYAKKAFRNILYIDAQD